MTKLLSVVVSVYNEELALREFYAEMLGIPLQTVISCISD